MLAKALAAYADQPGLLVLALPRGGVPVGYEVARALHAPLDVFVVRKLGLPGQEEFAMGAIASGGVRVLNREVVDLLGLSDAAIEAVAQREQRELERRERTYRDHRPAPEVAGRTILLVDDGIATGSTMRAAIQALRQARARRIVVGTPTAAWSAARQIEAEVDDFVALLTPLEFGGVGRWYDDFSQTTDDEVRALLQAAERPSPAPRP